MFDCWRLSADLPGSLAFGKFFGKCHLVPQHSSFICILPKRICLETAWNLPVSKLHLMVARRPSDLLPKNAPDSPRLAHSPTPRSFYLLDSPAFRFVSATSFRAREIDFSLLSLCSLVVPTSYFAAVSSVLKRVRFRFSH